MSALIGDVHELSYGIIPRRIYKFGLRTVNTALDFY